MKPQSVAVFGALDSVLSCGAVLANNSLSRKTIIAFCCFFVLLFATDVHRTELAQVTLRQLTVFILMAFGLHRLADLFFRNIRFLYTNLMRQPHDLKDRYGHGSWCLVTGGSDGIGLGFAVEFARIGFNVCMISRTVDKLLAAEKEVHQANPSVATKIISADFRKAQSPAFWDDLMEKIGKLDVSILVNNVGINRTDRFTDIPEEFLFDIVSVNCLTPLILTRRLINSMVNRPHRSAVINLSSVAGQRPLMFLSPYCATKSFTDFFSRSLSLEFEGKADFLSLRPGYVVTQMSKIAEKGGFVIDRYECARGCIDKLGYVSETYGDPRHAVYARSYFLLPEWLLGRRRKERLREKSK